MPPPLHAGRALVLRDARMGTHLWFVLTDPDPDRNSMVLVMLVTVKPHTDRTVQLNVGDHPFVRHESAVSADLLTRVRAGLLASARTPNDVVEYCRPMFTY